MSPFAITGIFTLSTILLIALVFTGSLLSFIVLPCTVKNDTPQASKFLQR